MGGLRRRWAFLLLAAYTPSAWSTTCPANAEPLLWRATRGNQTIYLAGVYSVPYSAVEPLPAPVVQAFRCADIAFFELACSLGDTVGVGNYMKHCKTYPISDAQDSIASRLSSQDLVNAQSAFRHLLSQAPTTCTGTAAKLKAEVDQMGSTDFRTTLQTLYLLALETLDPLTCQLAGEGGTKSGMEDELRSKMSGRPIYGLKDINMECALFQGNNVEQDTQLAKRLYVEFTNPSWLKNATAGQQQMAEIMKCGDLSALAALKRSMVHLPWLRTRMLAETNGVMAKGINAALAKYPNKALIAVLSVEHFLNASGSVATQGVPAIFMSGGFSVERISAAGSLSCSASGEPAATYEDGHCVRPVGQEQPASCSQFEKQWKQMLGTDDMYGRNRTKQGCALCVNSSSQCTCETQWTNTTPFHQLCTGTKVGNVSGQVLDMDLTRNPGSHRSGISMAAKTVLALFQYCYATSCNVDLAQEVSLRQWYKKDGSLTLAQVALHPPGQYPAQDGSSFSGVPSPLGSNWSWWSWVLAALLVAMLVAVLILCFRLPKRNERKKKPQPLLGRKGDQAGSKYAMNTPYNPQANDMYADNYEELKPLQGGTSGPPTPQQQQPAYPTPPMPMEPLNSMQFQRPMMPPQEQLGWPQGQQRMDPAASSPLKMADNSLLAQAFQMQQSLGEAGAQAVQRMQMHSMQGMQNSLLDGMGSPSASMAAAQPGSPFGSGLAPGLHPVGAAQPGLPAAHSMLVQQPAYLPQSGVSFQQPSAWQMPGLYGHPPSPTTAAAAGFPLPGQEFGGGVQYQFQAQPGPRY